MTSIPTKQLGLIDPANPPPGAVRLGRLSDPPENAVAGALVNLFAVEGLFVHHWQWVVKATGATATVNQFEMPLEGVRWIVQTIEQSFERKPSEGGLPRDVFHADTTIEQEHLNLRWGVSTGGEGVGGYSVHNFTRASYISNRRAQHFDFTRDHWRERVRQLLLSIAERYEAGEFKVTADPPPASE